MRIKGVSVSGDLIAEKVTEHARKLGIIRENEKLALREIVTDNKQYDYSFERVSN